MHSFVINKLRIERKVTNSLKGKELVSILEILSEKYCNRQDASCISFARSIGFARSVPHII
jgi:hypothetical protein